LKRIWTEKVVKSASLALAVVASGLGLFSDVGGVWSFLKDFKRTGEPLVAIQSRLSPLFRNPGYLSNHDDALLSIQLRNYSEAPVTLIAASLSVQNARTMAVATSGGAGGGCTLGPDRNKNKPVTIAPGGTQWITLGTHVELRGISSYLTDERLSGATVYESGGLPYTIREAVYVDDLNAYFERNYGRQAVIKVSMQSMSSEKQVLYFPIAQGKDLFASDGSLHHDWFIANWIGWENRRALGGYTCEL
jgi:hypothetical protein